MIQLPLLVDNLINWYIWKAKIKECNQEYHIYYRPFYPYVAGSYRHVNRYITHHFAYFLEGESHNTNIEEGICRIFNVEKKIIGMIRINSRKLQNDYTDYEGEEYTNKYVNFFRAYNDWSIGRFSFSQEFISLQLGGLIYHCEPRRIFIASNYKYSSHKDVYKTIYRYCYNVRVIYPD